MSSQGLSSISYELITEPKHSWMRLNRVLIAAVIILLVWAAFARIEIMVFSTGKVITASSVNMVQHLEGGIVAEIFVEKGSVVKQGDELLRIENINIDTQLAEVQNRLRGIDAELVRLTAEIANEDSVEFDPVLRTSAADIVRNEEQLFTENRRVLIEQMSQYNERIANSLQAEAELKGQIGLADESTALMAQELEVSEELLAQGAISRVEVLSLNRNLLSLKGDKQRLSAQLLGMQNEVKAVQQQLDTVTSDYTGKALNRRNELQNQRKELLDIIVGATDKSDRSIVRSPVDGVVNQILISTIGGVVQSGMDLLEIIPNDDDYLIEAKIKPADIGSLLLGQQANVRLTAYDFSIYGSLSGEVDYISANTLEERDGTQYYVAHVRIDNSLVKEESQYPVLSGMIANVDVITGKRTVLSYMTKPIVKTKQRALREQ